MRSVIIFAQTVLILICYGQVDLGVPEFPPGLVPKTQHEVGEAAFDLCCCSSTARTRVFERTHKSVICCSIRSREAVFLRTFWIELTFSAHE